MGVTLAWNLHLNAVLFGVTIDLSSAHRHARKHLHRNRYRHLRHADTECNRLAESRRLKHSLAVELFVCRHPETANVCWMNDHFIELFQTLES
jgi:hypothetical protein